MSKFRFLTGLVVVTAITSGLITLSPLPAEARSWNCQGSISTGNKIFTIPSFGLSGGILVDREARCKAEIKIRFLNNGAIYRLMNFTAAEATPLCGTGLDFHVEYGFDKRPKSWNFDQPVKPNCACTGLSYQG
jgi:hypothetical protein